MMKRRLQPAPRLSGQEFAAIDLGSNSFHMLVARMQGEELQVIDRLREPVRLAEGLEGGSRRLRPEVAQRALACLQRFGERLRDIPAAHVRAVGTNTMRKLDGGDAFQAAAEAALGHSIEVIAGLEEARLVYRGVVHGRGRAQPRRLVVDIGGGSTELIIGRGESPQLMESVSLGCVVHTQKHFGDGRISAARFKRARLAAGVELEFLQQPYRKAGWDVAIGSSGTIRGIWRVMKSLGRGDEFLSREGLEQVIELALSRGHISEIDFPALREDRRPVFIGGLAVLAGVFDALDIRRMETSDRALREGLLDDLIGRLSNHDVREQAVASMAGRYGVDLGQAGHLEHTALQILEQTAEAWDLEPKLSGQFLSWAARLHEVGLVITHNGYHKHGEYIVRNSDLAGFSQTDQKALAALVRLHRGKFTASALAELPEAWVEPVRYLAIILRLAYLLHRSRSPLLKPPLRVKANRRGIELQFTRKRWLDEHPLTRADLEREATYLEAVPLRLRIDG